MEANPESEPDPHVPLKSRFLFGVAEPDDFILGLTLGWGTDILDEIIRKELDEETPP